ncbi:MAG: FKBP-type peptidyl-prolyl cis-trans isomerase N-terminal domain-containing protein [Rikenellaceae bacterium]
MNRVITSLLISGVALFASCSGEPKSATSSALKSETDSLAYVIGMNIADNLIAMDSTINVAVVCRAIAEQTSSKALLTTDQARTYYLRYLTYVEPERKRGYEEQYLEDLAKSNRDFTRSKSGLTYNIAVIGDEEFTPKSPNDLVSLRYTISRIGGEEVFSSYENADTLVLGLKELQAGVQESVKMIGKGGKVNAWLPSKLAYGEAGDSLLRITPFETLYYQMELVDMEKNGATRNKR